MLRMATVCVCATLCVVPAAYARDAAAGDDDSAATQLQSVEIVATPVDHAIRIEQKLTPGALQIIDGEKLYERGVDNLADTFRYTPGVSMVSDSGADSGVLSIRGTNLTNINYDNSGVMLLQDGLPITTADGANHNRLPDPLEARDIVVANGANALTYGASQLGGAIDFVSRTALNSNPNQIYLYGGSDGLGGGRFSTGGVADDLDGMLTVDVKHLDGYQAQSRQNRFGVYGNIGWKLASDFKLRLFTSYLDNRQQLSGALTRDQFAADPRQANPTYAFGDHQLNVKTGRGALIGSWDINAVSGLDFGVSYEGQALYHPIVDVIAPFAPTSPQDEFFSLLIKTVQRTAGTMLRYHLDLADHKLLVGINFAYTSDAGGNFRNHRGEPGPRTDTVDRRANNITLFAMDRWEFAPRWTLVYGTQGVVTSRAVRNVALATAETGTPGPLDSYDRQQTYSSVNPRIGLIHALTKDSEAYANISRLYEAPNNFIIDNQAPALGNGTLKAMQGMSYEVGLRGNHALPFDASSVRGSLALYYAQIRNEVLAAEDPARLGNTIAANAGRTVHAGMEALLAASFAVPKTPWQVDPLLSFTYNHFRFDGDPVYHNNHLPYAPDYTLHGEVLMRQRNLGLYAGPTFDWVGARWADMNNTFGVTGHALVGFRAGIERGRWTLFAEATNLADQNYVSAVNVRLDAPGPNDALLYAGAPRAVFVGMRMHY
ncbi:MAG: TonB-dependent receptor [Nevskiaceae bacterium]|nr:MAG: TonB-dependent receptor [Nevskiaceae bacterium]TBR71938.1 MAG: TonB-dependent receptor [Nevskiaceae bacterium]